MKKQIRYFLFRILLILLVFVGASLAVPAQPPSPMSDPSEGGNNDPVGSGSIGGGLLILTVLGAGYGLAKMKQRKTQGKSNKRIINR